MGLDFWQGRRVLLTGHTGFKGAWLSLWLRRLGAEVTGVSLEPETEPSLWQLARPAGVAHVAADIRNHAALARAFRSSRPEVVFHLAAQSLVRRSYREPLETLSTNVVGTAAVLKAAAASPDVRSVVVVTSDKCYRNTGEGRTFVEGDPMGGLDPYSASKGAAELVTDAMRHSYFAPYARGGHPGRVASARAGNVIGGGDWSDDRLVPDIVRGCLGPEQRVVLRAPASVRPWQHVLEPLHGYLLLAEHLAKGTEGADSAWNFGPENGEVHSVLEVAEAVVGALGRGRIVIDESAADLHEAAVLQLDSRKAGRLGWRPKLDFSQTVELTARWYAQWADGADARTLCEAQIDEYERLAGDGT